MIICKRPAPPNDQHQQQQQQQQLKQQQQQQQQNNSNSNNNNNSLEKSLRFEDSKTFWVPRRKVVFRFSFEWFGKVGQFLEPNETTHEINSYERANSPLSDGAKQNSVRSIVFLLWFFESFFIFPHFLHFSQRSIFFIDHLEKSRRIPSAFWDLRRKLIFPFSHESFAEVGNLWSPNGATHEINSYERAKFSLSDGAKQNSVGSIVFELWFFESLFFCIFCIFPKNEVLSYS